MDQYWVKQIKDGLVYFKNGSHELTIPLGLIPGKVAIGDVVRIDLDDEGNVYSLKVILVNTTERLNEG